ncbi:hypothetical protein QRD86_00095 (plasmid) [Bacillus halotolerans]|uniref:hypothetical protein n=1 Tax=Bacillus halotolerans TaxID=260554 RepID=UPI002570C1CF|nr:hypothetical protein [Bacillus halotolerans]WJE41188.1 hypothetical protein QRD86_00095 [Bacillus halotolerans]
MALSLILGFINVILFIGLIISLIYDCKKIALKRVTGGSINKFILSDLCRPYITIIIGNLYFGFVFLLKRENNVQTKDALIVETMLYSILLAIGLMLVYMFIIRLLENYYKRKIPVRKRFKRELRK